MHNTIYLNLITDKLENLPIITANLITIIDTAGNLLIQVLNIITDKLNNLSIPISNITINDKGIFYIVNILNKYSILYLILIIIFFIVFCFFRYSYFNESKVNKGVKMNDFPGKSDIPSNPQNTRKKIEIKDLLAPAPAPNGNDDDDDDENKRNKIASEKEKMYKKQKKNESERNSRPLRARKNKEFKKSSFLSEKDKKLIDNEKVKLTRNFNIEKKNNLGLNMDK